ncbi:MAG TPA: LamG-like jellyroll fold domain-containing protein [Gemmataceae bacterium]|nr:LamG-like jellyroll fold domain-containing protein [Gemmataceae bacterium]
MGQAFSLNGAGQYVAVTGSATVSGPRTVEAWVKSDPNTGFGLPIITFGPSGQGDFFGIAGTTGNAAVGQYKLYVDHWGGPHAYASTVTVNPGTWNHVALTYDGASLRFYVNGQPAGAALAGLYDYPIDETTIGGNVIGGTTTKPSFSGQIDELSLYNRPLSDAEILSIYQAGPDGKNRFFVQSSTPAEEQIVATAPTNFLVRLSQPDDPASVQPGNLLVNGVPATSVTQTDAVTLTFHYATSPVTTAGPQTMHLASGAILATGTGMALADSTQTFSYSPGQITEFALDRDPTFGTGGTVSTVPTMENFVFAQQPDGKILVAGSARVRTEPQSDGSVLLIQNIAVARYQPDGIPDPSFGTNGVATVAIGSNADDRPVSVAVQPNGTIVILATARVPNVGTEVALLRLNPDGTPDTGFGPDHTGVVHLTGGSALALQGDTILVTFASSVGPRETWAVARYTAAGTLDPTFGPDGTGVVQLPGSLDPLNVYAVIDWRPSAMVVQGGQIYVAGEWQVFDDSFSDDTHLLFALVRLNADGQPDASYGGTAPNSPNSGDPSQAFTALATPGWAFAYAPGQFSIGSPSQLSLIFQTNGQAVLANTEGLTRLTADGRSENFASSDGSSGVVAEPDGKLLLNVGGAVIRLNPDLSIDTSFGPTGDGRVEAPGYSNIFAESDGRILAAGTTYSDTAGYVPSGSFLARFLSPNAPVPEGATLGLTVTTDAGVDQQNLTYSWAVSKDGTAYDSASGTNYQFTPNDNGSYVVSVIVTDNDGGSSTISRTLTVTNVAPAAAVAAPSGSAVAGEVLNFTLTAADLSSVDLAAGFTYELDWDGDGITDQTVTGPSGTAVNHAFTAAGSYTVRVRAEDKDGDFGPWATASVTINAVTPANLQQQLSPGGTVTVQTATPQQAHDVIAAANGLNPSTTPTATIIVDLGGQTVQDTTINVPPQVTLTFVNGTFIGGSPALIVGSGDVVVLNSTFSNSTDAPTILVTGGHLTLRNDIIQESIGYSRAAVEIAGGTVDLGTAADPGGTTLNINGAGAFVVNTTGNPIAAVGDTFLVNGVPLASDSLSGFVWEDFNGDGQIDFGEKGIAGVAVTLTGTDFLGNPVNVPATTDSDGAYIFANLRPGAYYLTETQPAGYLQGIDSVATDQFFVQLAQDDSGRNGLNYNFGEQPATTGPVQKGQTAGIGFWNNKNGQALIKALPVVTNADGSVTSVANWLAATLPHMFGADAGSNDLTGKTNAYVAALFQQDFLLKGVKLDAQVLATALSVYATNATLDSTGVAGKYGFTVSGDGVGTAAVNVGSNGDAFGVANNSTLTVMELLLATDAQAINGLLFNGNTTKRNEANTVFSVLNQAGGIG